MVLTPTTNALEEVVLEYKIPIEVKEDTITYNTDAFVNGQERKLREVLKKLPGIEVDREGNVTAQGKKVTKVLVEDKTFFCRRTFKQTRCWHYYSTGPRKVVIQYLFLIL